MRKIYALPKLNLYRLRKIVIGVFVISLIFSSGYLLGKKGYDLEKYNFFNASLDRSVPSEKHDIDFSLFWKVWDYLGSSYYDKSKLDPGKMVYGAIRGMVAALEDPYTVFLLPEENKIVQEDLQGNFEGIGIQIGFKGTQLAVIAPLPDTPAFKAGIQAGDYIIGIKDESKGIDQGTVGISLPEAVQIIRGPSGSKVTLVLLREGSDEPLIVEVVREDIVVPSVILSLEGEEKEIARIQLLKFGGETNGEWEKVIKDVLKSSIQGVILDLRNNPGGYLQGAVDIGGEFLENNSLVVYEEANGHPRQEFRTNKLPRLNKYPLVVLVNGGSASASEILAAALSEQAGVKIVGEKTFGKGTIQEPKQLEQGAGIHVTVAKWLTPEGNWVNEKGLEPDVTIKDDPETAEDEQLLEAIRLLK